MLLSLVEIRLLIAVSLSLMFPIERSIFDVRHFTAVSMDVMDCLRSYNSFLITYSSVATILETLCRSYKAIYQPSRCYCQDLHAHTVHETTTYTRYTGSCLTFFFDLGFNIT